jgi:hypothetical protein
LRREQEQRAGQGRAAQPPVGNVESKRSDNLGIFLIDFKPPFQQACGYQASINDSLAVLRQFQANAQAATHVGFQEKMTTDPHFLSKAVFEWWWITEGNRDRLFQFTTAQFSSGELPSSSIVFEAPGSWQPPPPQPVVLDVRS